MRLVRTAISSEETADEEHWNEIRRLREESTLQQAGTTQKGL
ncbi:hypothetical protein Spla01_06592 [Streptomyces platensis]|uniref:Uncharacterized protein n=1 Tax=Streptomyces platensis TaxID=58346 RepID=A0ABX3Y367_STRPT|nr:hypothetical protein [Streptomyces platensis]OSY47054.1 hypothetical protein BG653_01482 [Streptomyces platensis]